MSTENISTAEKPRVAIIVDVNERLEYDWFYMCIKLGIFIGFCAFPVEGDSERGVRNKYHAFTEQNEAWARTQRAPVIISLLQGLPVRALYRFGNIGSDADKSCFHRFFRIAENLGVADAILYRRCRDLLCGSGNANAHFSAIAALARSGHFTAMVANFIVRNLYTLDHATDALEDLLSIFQHPEYKNGLAAALTHVENIYTSSGRPDITTESDVGVICLIHASENKMILLNGHTGARDCLLCAIGRMFNVFSRGRPKMLASSE